MQDETKGMALIMMVPVPWANINKEKKADCYIRAL